MPYVILALFQTPTHNHLLHTHTHTFSRSISTLTPKVDVLYCIIK